MSRNLNGMRVAFLAANDGIEQVELTEPWKAVKDGGGEPALVAPEPGKAQAFHHLEKGDRFRVDMTTDELDSNEFDATMLPGGVANPDRLRTGSSRRRVRARHVRCREDGLRHLLRTVDARRGRCRAGPDVDVVAEPANGHPQCRRPLGGRRGRGVHERAQCSGDEQKARRPSGLLPRDAQRVGGGSRFDLTGKEVGQCHNKHGAQSESDSTST